MTFRLQDIPGVKSGTVDAHSISSVTAAIKHIRNNEAVTAAGDCGGLNVWLDDDRFWRCEFYRYRVTYDAQKYKTKAAAIEWIRSTLPKCKEPE